MALDPSIALGVKLPQIEGPAQQYQNMLALQNAQRQSQVGDLQYKNLLRDQQKQDAFSQDVQGADINTPEGMKRVQAAYLKMGNPKAAADLITADLERKVKIGQLDKQTRETDAIRAGQLSAGLAPLAALVQQGKTITHDDVFQIGNQMEASGLLPKGWQQSVPQNSMHLNSYVQNVVNRTSMGRDALAPFLPKPQAVGGDILNFAPQSPDFLTRLGSVSPTAGERSAAANRPFSADGTPNLGVQQHELNKARTGAASNTVKLPAVESEYSKTFAKQTADEDVKMLGIARNAPKVANTANRVAELLAKPEIFVGPAATVKLQIARALNILGADETESMRNTERLIAASGQGTLDAIKDANLGTGQGFTEKDLSFLREIAGGRIDLTSANLSTMARLQHRAAELSVKKWQERRANMPESATKGTGIDKETYELPARVGGPTPESIAYLKANPNTKAAFNKRYGDGEAEHTLRMGK
jgi:hypothetical protein